MLCHDRCRRCRPPHRPSLPMWGRCAATRNSNLWPTIWQLLIIQTARAIRVFVVFVEIVDGTSRCAMCAVFTFIDAKNTLNSMWHRDRFAVCLHFVWKIISQSRGRNRCGNHIPWGSGSRDRPSRAPARVCVHYSGWLYLGNDANEQTADVYRSLSSLLIRQNMLSLCVICITRNIYPRDIQRNIRVLAECRVRAQEPERKNWAWKSAAACSTHSNRCHVSQSVQGWTRNYCFWFSLPPRLLIWNSEWLRERKTGERQSFHTSVAKCTTWSCDEINIAMNRADFLNERWLACTSSPHAFYAPPCLTQLMTIWLRFTPFVRNAFFVFCSFDTSLRSGCVFVN